MGYFDFWIMGMYVSNDGVGLGIQRLVRKDRSTVIYFAMRAVRFTSAFKIYPIALYGYQYQSFDCPACCAFASLTVFQAISANGFLRATLALTSLHVQVIEIAYLSAPYCWALSLVACLAAYRAAIPWKMIASLNNAKDAAQVNSSSETSKPVVSIYHFTTCSLVGRPGKSLALDFESDESRKASSACIRGQSGVVLEIVQG